MDKSTFSSLTGTARYIAPKKLSVQIVAVEPKERVPSSPHRIQGLGAGFVSKVLERGLIDEGMTTSSPEAFAMAKRLALEESMLVGPTKRMENKDTLIVTILPSFGECSMSSRLFGKGARLYSRSSHIRACLGLYSFASFFRATVLSSNLFTLLVVKDK
ncbi:hypothetical protein PsorP6_011336 [Peronosclerospora sorghi]|uniref:Uncharacterized protein n=1 Tax=Peronosclerospora sorghi TaxID=230839 RepID=A0ACC0WLV2_9STRA|nr:hypothetical protein PsorP6_011336 [Peronosclerospora sorghi]